MPVTIETDANDERTAHLTYDSARAELGITRLARRLDMKAQTLKSWASGQNIRLGTRMVIHSRLRELASGAR